MKISILFVEDEPLIREELSSFLKRYTEKSLYIAENGEEGLALYRKKKPDVVISDIRMPKMNGIQMVQEIKKINPDQTVLFATAHSDSNFFIDAIELQVEGYLLKPIDLGLLRKKIKKIQEDIAFKKQLKMQEVIANEIAHLQGNMLAVLDQNYIPLFLNKKWMELLNINSLEEIAEGQCISRFFQDKEGYFYPSGENICRWVEELKSLDNHSQIVAIQMNKDDEARVYAVTFSDIEETKHLIVSFSEITYIEKEKTSYQKQAHTDALTQLPNRTKFNQELDNAIGKAELSNEKLSIILFDLDLFKNVNDTYGHLVGDDMLVELSTAISTLIRSNDMLARWGGEEFVVLLPNTDIKGAEILAEKMRMAVEKYPFSHGISLTCSFGVACMCGEKETPTSIFSKADKALYKAKNRGRNKVVSY